MDNKKIKIAVFGTGFGKTHASIYASFPDVEVVGIAGRNQQKTMEAAQSLGIEGFTDFDMLINREDIDAIDICLPTEVHSRFAVDALNHGKSVFCEMPIAYTMEDAIQMKEAAQKTGKLLMIGLFSRFQSDNRFICELVNEQRLGKLKYVFISRRTAPVWGEWNENFVLDLMMHDIDSVYWLLGQPRTIASRGMPLENGGWNHVNISMQYPETHVEIEGCGIMPSSFPFSTSLHIVGEKGTIDHHWYWGGAEPVSEIKFYPDKGEPQILTTPGYDPYVAELRYFVDCLKGAQTPEDLWIDATFGSMEMAVLAKRSLQEEGRIIQLEGSSIPKMNCKAAPH